MAEYSVQTLTKVGLNPTANAVAATDTFDNDGQTVLRVQNDNASPCNVTIVTPGNVDDDLAVPDRVVSVPAGEVRYIGPLRQNVYNVDGEVTVNYSVTASVVAECIRMAGS